MANTYKRLGASRPVDTNNAILYTVPASTTTIMKSLRVCNNSSSNASIRVFLVPNGGTADETTCIYYDYNIPANSTLSDDGSHILEASGTIQVRTGTADVITFTASGLQIT